MHTIVKNVSFYRANFRNRPIVSIDGYDETVHCGPFRLSRDGRPRFNPSVSVIKCLKYRPLDRDPTAEMRSAPKHLSCYNSFINARA